MDIQWAFYQLWPVSIYGRGHIFTPPWVKVFWGGGVPWTPNGRYTSMATPDLWERPYFGLILTPFFPSFLLHFSEGGEDGEE